MSHTNINRLSKFVSLVLRHHPEAAGIELDGHGWADVDKLIEGIQKTGRRIDRELLDEIVRTDDKQRYSYNDDGTKIRANQGHSVHVDVDLAEMTPPDCLFHGTAERFLEPILREGLRPMGRLYVHLSPDEETAEKVGQRHGKPVILRIDAGRMARDGHKFRRSENGVWLTESVPKEYLELLSDILP